jgi:hypothetical protein
VLIDTPDYDSLLASIASLAKYIDQSGAGAAGTAAQEARRLHLQQKKPWDLDVDGSRVRAKLTSAEKATRGIEQRDVMAVGEIALTLLYDPSILVFAAPGMARVKSLIWCVGFFGGDTVPQPFDFTPRCGYAAMKFLGARLNLPAGGHGGTEVTVATRVAALRLVRAAVFLHRPSTFSPGSVEPATWVADADHEEVAYAVHIFNSDLKYQMYSEGQTEVQAAKMDARLNEWEAGAQSSSGLVSWAEECPREDWQRTDNASAGAAPTS